MLKIKEGIKLEQLKEYGFKSIKLSRFQTNYYFACRRGGRMILVNDVSRELLVDKVEEDDNRVHSVVKWQPKETLIEDGIFDITTAGLVEKA